MTLMDHEGAFLMARYADDMQQMAVARVWWRYRVGREARANGWRTEDAERFQGLADATLEEWLGDSNCRVCKGVGSQPDASGLVVACPTCEGTRKQYPSERAMARALNVSVQAYRETWGLRTAWCRRWLHQMEMAAVGRLSRGLRP
jgi:hypothetical protein